MKFSEAVKPISYLKTHASEVIRDVSENQKTLIITHNGEAKVILQDVKVYEKTQESIALLKILALSGKEVRKGKYRPIEKSFANVKNRIDDFKRGQSEVQS
ncbi:MAG: type II toxin-antitoxin system Phd/YefM family antitoxin [Bacteroidetes bacterium]|nr:type II toxin-antitoxin system Phd/YefM family antitoxin [Bacteroidota bacterium]MBU1680862.1 type II toxin-antitoxin system Phd/YefM family antitoxin [Bacteroidota bacterium]MBU2506915.1 type II toxin-antitoxin system Phd/YefM family antitoxin [Bacteroidota bacterium]